MADRPKHLNIGNPITWVLIVIDRVGELLDPEANPAFTVRKNGTPIADTVVVVKRAATTGTYDCAYLPSVDPSEGDQFTIQEFITVDPGSGVTSHTNTWEFITNPIDPSGTGTGIRQVDGILQDNELTKIGSATVEVLDSGGTSLNLFDTTTSLGEFAFNLNDGDYIFLVGAVPGYQTDTGTAYTVSVSSTTPLLTLNLLVEEEVVIDPDAIDLSGMKRVKTKHMEIEAFSPVVMQAARDRENAAPSFCEVDMCRGVSVRRGCW